MPTVKRLINGDEVYIYVVVGSSKHRQIAIQAFKIWLGTNPCLSLPRLFPQGSEEMMAAYAFERKQNSPVVGTPRVVCEAKDYAESRSLPMDINEKSSGYPTNASWFLCIVLSFEILLLLCRVIVVHRVYSVYVRDMTCTTDGIKLDTICFFAVPRPQSQPVLDMTLRNI